MQSEGDQGLIGAGNSGTKRDGAVQHAEVPQSHLHGSFEHDKRIKRGHFLYHVCGQSGPLEDLIDQIQDVLLAIVDEVNLRGLSGCMDRRSF